MSLVKTRKRIVVHGEVFTPPGLVADMCDLPGVAHECGRIESRFFAPACGKGAFLCEVLSRQLRRVDKNHPQNPLRWQRNAFIALGNLYGIDLLADNAAACRDRLLTILAEAFAACFETPLPSHARQAYAYVLSINILRGDALTLLDASARPIVCPEWSMVHGIRVKRRDSKFEHLIGHAQTASAATCPETKNEN